MLLRERPLTPLEFFYVWHYVQTELDDATRTVIVAEGLRLYGVHQQRIVALEAPLAPGQADHFDVAQGLNFACPMLSPADACREYPVRELLALWFGCSFNDAGGPYACHIVADHLADQTVTLVQARPTWRRLLDLPLTGKRRVYPYYIYLLFDAQA